MICRNSSYQIYPLVALFIPQQTTIRSRAVGHARVRLAGLYHHGDILKIPCLAKYNVRHLYFPFFLKRIPLPKVAHHAAVSTTSTSQNTAVPGFAWSLRLCRPTTAVPLQSPSL